MYLYLSLEEVQLQNAWLTIGSFDGVHRGHQEIVHRLTAGAHAVGAPAVVLTFFPHPAVVLGRQKNALYLTTPQERAALLGDLGVDVVIIHSFDKQVAATSANNFIAKLAAKLGLNQLIVGHDFALGRDREGNVPTLRRVGKELGYTLQDIPAIKIEGEIVSSSQIRTALLRGEVERATHLLGRPYRINGKVVPGDGRGRKIGFPTANLDVWLKRAIPKAGVYVCQARVNDRTRDAVTNIGVRPTFVSQYDVTIVETHLLDFEEEIYGQEVQLDFLSRLRNEQRFPNVEALVNQIKEDIAKAKKTLSS